MRRLLGALASVALLSSLAAATVSATHQAQGDWELNNPNDPNFKGVFDEQLLIYPEAASTTSKPFLSLNDEAAGAADHVVLDASATSGVSSMAASVQAARPTGSYEVALSGGLPTDVFVNLSRPILGRVYWSHTALQAAAPAQRGVEATMLRVELFSGTRRIGAYDDVVAPVTAHKSWLWISVNMWPEVASLKQGDPLTLKVTRSGGLGDLLLGTGGDHQTRLDLRFTSVDPLSGALYLQDRRIISYQGGPPGDEVERAAASDAFERLPPGIYHLPELSTEPSTASPLPLLALASLAALAAPRKRRTVVLLLLLAATSFAGCAAPAPSEKEEASTKPTPSASVTFEPLPNQTKSGIGSIAGSVESEEGLPLANAHISLLGTNLFTSTDKKGAFGFETVPMGSYTMRVDLRGYLAYEDAVVVRAGNLTRVTIVMVTEVEKPAANRPHQHGPWGDETRLPLQSKDFTYAGCKSGADQGSSASVSCGETAIPIEMQKPVPPGTGMVEVRLSWNPTQGAATELALVVTTGITHYQWLQRAGSGTGVFSQTYGARKSGENFHIPIFPNEADPGHQLFTNWKFAVKSAPMDPLSPSQPPQAQPLNVHVEIFAHRGVIPYEPAHRDLWQGRTEIPLFAEHKMGPGADTGLTASFPNFNAVKRLDYTKDGFIPPGTKEVRGYLRWENSVGLDITKWGVAYRPADQSPSSSVYPEATMTGAAPNRTFVIQPTASQTDQMYQRTPYWWLFVEDEDQSYNSSPRTTWYMGAVAIRDPAWVDVAN